MPNEVLLLALVGLVVAWVAARRALGGADMSAFDEPTGERYSRGETPGAEIGAVIASLGGIQNVLRGVPFRQRNAVLRKYMDEIFAGRELGVRIAPVAADGVRGEWVLPPGADPSRRTLYIHGGAFVVGSPKSHRTLTARFAELSGGAVLAVDYRLMPEHPRRAGIDDCRAAYRWLLQHGPDGAQPASALFVAGDSAGGNLALALIQWVRDEGLRAPDAVVALSPLTDATMSSPSLRTNLRTDPMLGPLFGRLALVPHTLMLVLGWLQTRIRPADPLVSPLRGDLSQLPPTLVQASEAEMLFDDSQRYVNRARAAGSPARLQRWAHMVHVWQIFNPELPEARDALAEIGRFLEAVAPRRPAAASAGTAPAEATIPG